MISDRTAELYRFAKRLSEPFWTLPVTSCPLLFRRNMSGLKKLKAKQVYILANGDLRLSANQVCWAEQSKMEAALSKALKAEGWVAVRAHGFDRKKKHGFIDSQKRGMEVFRTMDPDAPLIVAECVWQYSQHILPGLSTHRGPVLTVANWSGTWPGLVGMLNLNGSLTKIGVEYSTLWSEKFADQYFRDGLRQWLSDGEVTHDLSHVRDLERLKLPLKEVQFGQAVARALRDSKAIMGVFDEGCMGMHNAIIPDELLNPTGLFKERLSQSAVPDCSAHFRRSAPSTRSGVCSRFSGRRRLWGPRVRGPGARPPVPVPALPPRGRAAVAEREG